MTSERSSTAAFLAMAGCALRDTETSGLITRYPDSRGRGAEVAEAQAKSKEATMAEIATRVSIGAALCSCRSNPEQ